VGDEEVTRFLSALAVDKVHATTHLSHRMGKTARSPEPGNVPTAALTGPSEEAEADALPVSARRVVPRIGNTRTPVMPSSSP